MIHAVFALIGDVSCEGIRAARPRQSPTNSQEISRTSLVSAAAFLVRSVSTDSEDCEGAIFGTHFAQKIWLSPKSETCGDDK